MRFFTPTSLKAAAVALLLSCGVGMNATELTLYEGATGGSTEIPLWIYWGDAAGTKSQFIYPAENFETIVGKSINSMSFVVCGASEYSNEGFRKSYSMPISVKVGTTTKETFTAEEYYDGSMIEVYNGVYNAVAGNTQFKIDFATPFVYSGDNLIVDITFTQAISGGVDNNYFKGESTPFYNAICGHGSSRSQKGFYPTVTIECGDPLPYLGSVSPGNIKFNRTAAGEVSVKTVKVSNLGTESVPVSISGLEGTPFSAVCDVTTLASLESTEVTVTYAPVEGGNHSATMTVDLGEAGTFDVSLTGESPVIVDGVIEIAGELGTNDELPLYLYNLDTNGMGSQIIYTAEQMQRAVGQQITGLKYFVAYNKGYDKDWSAPISVKLGKVETDRFESATIMEGDFTEVFNGTVTRSTTDNTLEFVFDRPFIYTGGNLLVDMRLTDSGSAYLPTSFTGKYVDYSCALAIKSPTELKVSNFFPYTVITYEEYNEYDTKISNENLTFKNLKIGSSQELSVELTNNGLNTLPVSISGLEGTPFSAVLPAMSLAMSESMIIPVTFTPTEEGTFEATLLINTGETRSFDVALKGYCKASDDKVLYIEIEPAVIPGMGEVIALNLGEATLYEGLQFDITMPEGLDIKADEDNYYEITLGEQVAATHVIDAMKLGNGNIRVLIYSLKAEKFANGEGIINLPVVASADFNGGDIVITNCNVSQDGVSVDLPGSSIHVAAKQLYGDSNDDLTVNIVDIVTTSSYIMEFDPQPFSFVKADVNCDSRINVADVSETAKIILAQPAGLSRRAVAARSTGAGSLSIGDTVLDAKGYATIPVILNTDETVTALQAEIKMPANLVIENITLASSQGRRHVMEYSKVDETTSRVLIYSTSLAPLKSGETLLNIDVRGEWGDGWSFTEGDIAIGGVIASDKTGNTVDIADTTAEVRTLLPSGVGSISADSQTVVRAHNGGISVDTAEGARVAIYTASGMVARSFTSTGHDFTGLATGLYIVTVNGSATKVIVK